MFIIFVYYFFMGGGTHDCLNLEALGELFVFLLCKFHLLFGCNEAKHRYTYVAYSTSQSDQHLYETSS